MRRKTRKALSHLVIFSGALFCILFLNRPQSSNRAYSWNKIRYQGRSAILPENRGICQGLEETTSKPAIVVARVSTDGDPEWLDALKDKYHLCVYTADAPLDTDSFHLQTPANRGHEAMAYLTFLIDNYDNIPAVGTVFVHGSRWAWHNDSPDYDNAVLLLALNISAALKPFGYHNLRCDWSVGTCLASEAPQGSLETSIQALMVPWDSRAKSDAALPGSLAALFGNGTRLSRSDTVRAQCCAQFVVSRASIWQHSREEYVAIRQWLLDSGGDASPRDDKIAGRILSYVWHILFLERSEVVGNDGVNLNQLNGKGCPRADECYCRLYGRCQLEGCTAPGSCYGQYHLPRNFRLPADWGVARM